MAPVHGDSVLELGKRQCLCDTHSLMSGGFFYVFISELLSTRVFLCSCSNLTFSLPQPVKCPG